MAELGFRQTEILAPLVPETAEAAFLPTLPGVTLDLSALADRSASIRIDNGNLVLAPAFGPVIVLEGFVAATADRPIPVILPGGTVVPSDQLIEFLSSPVDLAIADIIAMRLAATAPSADAVPETTGSPEPDPAPPRLRDDETRTSLADAPPETVRGRAPEVAEQASVAGSRPDIALAPPPPENTPPPPAARSSLDERTETEPPPSPATETAPATVSGSSGNDTITLAAVAAGLTVDLGTGDDILTLADGSNDVTVRNVETVQGSSGDDTVRLSDVPTLIDLGEGVDTLDFSALGAADLGNAGTQYQGIEVAELRGGAGTTLTLSAPDVLDLSPDSDTLLVQGGSDDGVTIGSGWATSQGTTSAGEPATIYTQSLGGHTVTVVVESDVSVA